MAVLALLCATLPGCGEPPASAAADDPVGALVDMGPDGALPSALPDEEEMPLPEIPTAEDPEAPCQPGATRCLDPVVAQTCLRDGTWADTPCDRGHACVDGPDRCLPVQCVPGKTRCDGRWGQQACAEDGRNWSFTEACSLEEQCVGGGCRVCAPNATECTGAATRKVCRNDGGAWLAEEVCETGLCFLGECLVCVPGEGRCIDDSSLRRCRPDGMGLADEVIACTGDDVCDRGRCRPRCSTRILVVVDDSQPMQRYLDVLKRVLDDIVVREGLDLAFMSARAQSGCGNGVLPPEVSFGRSEESARDWVAALTAEGNSQITDLVTWLIQNKESVWDPERPAHMVILTAGGDRCGPEGNRARVSWNRGTYEQLGGTLRRSAIALDIVDVGGDTDPQLDQLGICNGRGPAITQLETDAFEDELRTLLGDLLTQADLCDP